MWASYVKGEQMWVIKTLLPKHNYLYQHKNKLVTATFLVERYGERIRKNPNWKLAEMREEFRKELKVGVCISMCHRVRRRAMNSIEAELRYHYEGLRRFGGEILKSNKENIVKIMTTREDETDAPHFKRFYVCYAELKKAWKQGCRPVLGLDGCFLKTVCGGQLLVTIGRDGNNAIFPIAMDVVETESYDSWQWFLMLLADDLNLGNCYGLTIISDQQKGLTKAVKELIPHVEHRNCTRHLYGNLRGKHGSEAVRDAFYESCTATHPEAFKAAMKKLEKADKGAYEKMSKLEPKLWSKAYFETHSKSDLTENNMSECFNSWILQTRYMPVINMLTDIHDMIMERLHLKRDLLTNVDTVLLPKGRRLLEAAIKDSTECRVLWDGRENYQVKWRGIGYCVNLNNQTCSCRVWDLTGIPCLHGVSAILKSRKDPLDFVSAYYTNETYMKCYSHCLEVLRGRPFWEEVDGDIILPPPVMKVLRGRPKKQRRREGWESQASTSNKGKKPEKMTRV